MAMSRSESWVHAVTIALVPGQTAQNHVPSGNSLTVTLPNPPAAGNCLVACIGGHNANTVSSVVLGFSDADNWAAALTNDVGAITGEIWIDPDCDGSSAGVTIHTANAGQINAQVFEFSGVSTSPLDVSTSAQNLTPSSSWSSGTSGTAAAGDAWIGMCSGYAGVIYSLTGPSSPWTNEAVLTNSSGTPQVFSRFIAGYQVSSSAGTVTYAGVSTGSPNTQVYAALAISLTAAGGGGGGGAATGSFLPFFA